MGFSDNSFLYCINSFKDACILKDSLCEQVCHCSLHVGGTVKSFLHVLALSKATRHGRQESVYFLWERERLFGDEIVLDH